MFFLLFILSLAQAQMVVLQPQNRISTGLAWTDGSLGLATSFDSRLSQIIYVNVGGFRSLKKSEMTPIEDDPQSWVALRHGLWAAPGFRIPHRYKKNGINWDLILRGGFGSIFVDLFDQDDSAIMELAGLYGIDFLLRKKKMGIRSTAKIFSAHPYIYEFREKIWMHRLHATAEIFYQW